MTHKHTGADLHWTANVKTNSGPPPLGFVVIKHDDGRNTVYFMDKAKFVSYVQKGSDDYYYFRMEYGGKVFGYCDKVYSRSLPYVSATRFFEEWALDSVRRFMERYFKWLEYWQGNHARHLMHFHLPDRANVAFQ